MDNKVIRATSAAEALRLQSDAKQATLREKKAQERAKNAKEQAIRNEAIAAACARVAKAGLKAVKHFDGIGTYPQEGLENRRIVTGTAEVVTRSLWRKVVTTQDVIEKAPTWELLVPDKDAGKKTLKSRHKPEYIVLDERGVVYVSYVSIYGDNNRQTNYYSLFTLPESDADKIWEKNYGFRLGRDLRPDEIEAAVQSHADRIIAAIENLQDQVS